MKDKQFLQWLYDRLKRHYELDPNLDYMLKLKSIIEATPEGQFTPNTAMVDDE